MQPSTRRFWRTLCFHLLTSFMEIPISFSSRTIAPAHTARTTSKWFSDHDITDLNPIWNLWDIFKEKDLKRLIQKHRWAEGSIVPQQCHRLIAYMPHLTDAIICAKVTPTKYWVHKWTNLKELELFCFANTFFLLILGNILIFWYTGFLNFMSCKV